MLTLSTLRQMHAYTLVFVSAFPPRPLGSPLVPICAMGKHGAQHVFILAVDVPQKWCIVSVSFKAVA